MTIPHKRSTSEKSKKRAPKNTTPQDAPANALRNARYGDTKKVTSTGNPLKSHSDSPLDLSSLAKSAAKGAITGGVAGAAANVGKELGKTAIKDPVGTARAISSGELTQNATVNKALKASTGLAGVATRKVLSGVKPKKAPDNKSNTPTASTAANPMHTARLGSGPSPIAGPTVSGKYSGNAKGTAKAGSANSGPSGGGPTKNTKVGGSVSGGSGHHFGILLLLFLVLLLMLPLLFVAAILGGAAFPTSKPGYAATSAQLASATAAMPATWLTIDKTAGAKYTVPWPLLAGVEYVTTDFGTKSPYKSGTFNYANDSEHIGGQPGEGQGDLLLSPKSATVTSPYSITGAVNSLAKSLATIEARHHITLSQFDINPFASAYEKTLPTILSTLPIIIGPCASATGPNHTTTTVPTYAWQCASTQQITTPTPLSITTSSLPTGTVGAQYTAMVYAHGGVPPYYWTLTKGHLPPGLSIQGQQLSGIPTQKGSYSFSLRVTDTSVPTPAALTQTFTVSVNTAPPPAPSSTPPTSLPLKISTTILPAGAAGTAYTTTIAENGGTPPYTWSITKHTPLPLGLSLNDSSGVISGTVSCNIADTTAYTVSVQVSDTSTPIQTAQHSYSLLITGAYADNATHPACSSEQTTSPPSKQTTTPSSTTTTTPPSTTTTTAIIQTVHPSSVPNITNVTDLLASLYILTAQSTATDVQIQWKQLVTAAISEAQTFIGNNTCSSHTVLASFSSPTVSATVPSNGQGVPKANITLTKDWVTDFLAELGYPDTPQNIEFIQAWIQAESGGWADGTTAGKFNPIDTTQHWPVATAKGADSTDTIPSTDYGGAGQNGGDPVQDYASYADGVWANAYTLLNSHYYAPLEQALQQGNSAIADAEAEAQTPWGTGTLILKVLENGGPTDPLQGSNWLGPHFPPAMYNDGITYDGPAPTTTPPTITITTGKSSNCNIQTALTNYTKTGGSLGASIASLALSQMGQNNNTGQYGPTGEAWCALFTTWVWGHSGVNIPSMAFTGDIYNWGQANGHVLPPTATPQVGDALLYGTGPQNSTTSMHVNIVVQVLPNGQVLTVGGNETNTPGGEVSPTPDGPFTITSAVKYMGMPIYAIVQP